MDMTNDPSDELLGRARQGDAEARGELLDQQRVRLEAFLRLHMGDPLRARESAADLVQSVFLLSFQDEALWKAEDTRRFRGRLMMRAQHKLIDHARFHRRGQRDAAREEDSDSILAEYGALCTPSRDAIAKEEIARIETAFAALPEDYRKVILMSRFADMNVQEMARDLDRNEGAVWTLLSRALARLSMLLDSP